MLSHFIIVKPRICRCPNQFWPEDLVAICVRTGPHVAVGVRNGSLAALGVRTGHLISVGVRTGSLGALAILSGHLVSVGVRTGTQASVPRAPRVYRFPDHFPQ